MLNANASCSTVFDSGTTSMSGKQARLYRNTVNFVIL